jgi:hypothetical protein
VRNLSPSPAEGESEVWSGVVSWSARGEVRISVGSKVGVIRYVLDLVLDEVDMYLSGSVGRGPRRN